MLANISLVGGSFTIVKAQSLKQAETWARWDFGNSNVQQAEEATWEDVGQYEAMGGMVHEAKIGEVANGLYSFARRLALALANEVVSNGEDQASPQSMRALAEAREKLDLAEAFDQVDSLVKG